MKYGFDCYGNVVIVNKDKCFKDFMFNRKGTVLKVKAVNRKSAVKKMRKGFYVDMYA